MAWEDLDEEERAAVLRVLREVVDYDPFPLSPRVRTLKAILAKLEPPPTRTEPLPPPKAPRERSMALTRKRRR